MNILKKALIPLALIAISGASMAAPSASLKKQMAEMGSVQKVEPFVSGLTAWTIKAKNQKEAIFFTTADEKTIIHGTVYNAKDKKNLSNQLKQNKIKPQGQKQILSSAKGYDHEVFKAVKKLHGVVDGNKENPNTVYVLYDPRCLYCHQAFNKTREYVKNGASIKWIPLLAINQSENGKQMAAGLLRKNSIEAINSAFNGSDKEKNSIKVIPTSKELETINLHNEFLKAVFFHHEDIVIVPHDEKMERKNLREKGLTPPPLKPGVPLAIFVNKQGVLEARRGISEDIALQYIFNQN